MSANPHIGVCPQCGLDHSLPARLVRLRRALPASTAQLLERYPCLYEDANGQIAALLRRDLRAIGAVRDSLCGVEGLDADREWRAGE